MAEVSEVRPESEAGFEPATAHIKHDFVNKSTEEAEVRTMSVNEYIAGALGGVAGVFVGHPFDTTKIQLQIRTAGEHKLLKTSHAWNMVKAEGFKKGIFRGMFFPVVSYGFVNAIFFGVNGNTIKLLEPDHRIVPSAMQVYIAGCVAGAAQLVLSCPVEVVKCTMQAQIPLKLPENNVCASSKLAIQEKALNSTKYYRGPIQCCRDILVTEGPKGLYKGCVTMFFRDVPTYGLYLLVYEDLYKVLVERNLSDAKGMIASMLAGGVAGCVAWLVVMPLDVIKSRLQTVTSGFATASVDHTQRFRGFWDCAVSSVRNGGYSVLFRGTVLCMARAFPVNAVTFLVYSQFLKELEIINPPLRPKLPDDGSTPAL